MHDSMTRKKNNVPAETMNAFQAAGFTDINMLREAAASLSCSSELAELFGLDTAAFNDLIESTSLANIHGLGGKYINLLETVGISTVAELRACNPFELHLAIKSAIMAGHDVGRIPNRVTVEFWIEQAQAIRS